MASERPSYDEFSDMPVGLRDFLLSDELSNGINGLKKDYALDDVEGTTAENAIMDAAFNEISLSDAVSRLKQVLVPKKIANETWPAFLAAFIRVTAWPLRELFGEELTKVIQEEKISMQGWPGFRVFMNPLTYSGAATEIATTAGFSVLGGPVRERLRELIMSKLKGVRTDAQVMDVLTRSVDFGGIGLDRTAAERAQVALNDILSRAAVLSEDEYADWLSAEARRKSAPAPAGTDASVAAASVPSGPATELDTAIDATLAAVTYRPPDDYLAKRLRNVVSSRLRNVRNQMEVKQLLARDVKVGGMGLDATTAESVAGQIEETYRQFHEKIEKEEKGKIEVQLEGQKVKVEERRRREAEEHARWFEEKIRTRKTGEARETQAIEAMRGAMHPLDAKEERMETAKFGPLVATPSSPVKVSPATVKLAETQSVGRPTMDGMTYGGPQLVGLVGELKRMSVSEFRRLSKNPQEAATKIRQKIETLGQEAFEKRAEGIRAFQESPLQAAYLGLVGESFKTMTPVAQLAESKRKAGEDTLSSDEIAAVVTLNSALHY